MPSRFSLSSNRFRTALLDCVSHRALALALLGASTLYTPLPARADDPVALPEISVEGERSNDYQTAVPTLPKLTEPLRDTPQSITVVPRQVLDDRATTSTTDALRNVPGVSLQAGEAGGGQGDNLSLRGFSARNDIFLDGMRDLGAYYRDAFNLESVEVLKGPSSVLFGRGSTGGVINQVSKSAHLGNDNQESISVGDNGLRRATADVNQQWNDTTAFRLNLMGETTGVAGRDVTEYQRFGAAASLAAGIGTETRTTFNYFHQTENDTPDYGMPWLFGRPAPVARRNYYGFSDGSNYFDATADVGTLKLEHDVDATTTIRNQTRAAYYTRKLRITEPQIPGSATASTPPASITVTRNQINIQSQETFFQNQTEVQKSFDTRGIGHTVVAGVEVGYETSSPLRLTYAGVPGTNLVSPNPDQPFTFSTATLNTNASANATSVGVYALDTIKLTPQWELVGGLRWDRFDSHVNQVSPTATSNFTFDRVDSKPSYRAAVVYKPVEQGSIYVSYGTSFNPSAEALTTTRANGNLAPEENRTYEAGSKWDLLNDRMSLRGAVYQLERTNARVPDPTNTAFNTLDGEQRVQGFEVEGVGRLTESWQVFAGYNYMDGKVTKSTSAATAAAVGSPLTNTPRHTATLWSTYDLDRDWQVGAGMNYVSQRVARNTGIIERAPGYTTFDLMAKYRLTETVDFQVNVYNLTDKYYWDLLHPSHVVPGAGRTVLFTTHFKL
ncbi:MAG TPA: TonB-dependent siderophore receptor [Alphaproteobacteria bacterium]|jgi:catecholate siderophore receptor|nr:TonB-dependent siderophore receptor [Alphaproteobacteria bacterium]